MMPGFYAKDYFLVNMARAVFATCSKLDIRSDAQNLPI
jgi:hypothetical protein